MNARDANRPIKINTWKKIKKEEEEVTMTNFDCSKSLVKIFFFEKKIKRGDRKKKRERERERDR